MCAYCKKIYKGRQRMTQELYATLPQSSHRAGRHSYSDHPEQGTSHSSMETTEASGLSNGVKQALE